MSAAQLERMRALHREWKNAMVAGDYEKLARIQAEEAKLEKEIGR